jgi:hypothetical protein
MRLDPAKPGAISANLGAAFSPPARQLPNPATIRNSTLLFPAIPKNAPCSLSSGESYQDIETIGKLNSDTSALPAISENHPANRKLQGEPSPRPFRF